MIPTIRPAYRSGTKVVHQAPDGAHIAFVPEVLRDKYIAVVAPRDDPPYLVRRDGSIEPLDLQDGNGGVSWWL